MNKTKYNSIKLLEIKNIDDIMIFLYVGVFIFDKLLPFDIYFIFGALFVLYFFLKLIINGKLAMNKAILWQLFFILISLFSLLYSEEILIGIIYTIITTFCFIFTFSQYFSVKNTNTTGILKVLQYFIFWGCLFTLYVFVTQFKNFGSGGRLGTRALGDQFGGATAFSYYSILIAILLIWYTFYTQNKKWFYLIMASAAMFLNMMTGGRKAVLLPVFFVIIYGYMLNRKKALNMIKYVVLSLFLLYIIIQISLKVPLINDVFGYRIESMMSLFIETSNTDITTINSDKYRFTLIGSGLELFLDKPLLGYGIGSSRLLFDKAGLGYRHAHNNFIEMLLSGGIIMFISWYWIYVYLITNIWKLKRFSDKKISYFFISILLVNLVSDIGSTMYNVLHFNYFVTIASVYIKILKNKRKNEYEGIIS